MLIINGKLIEGTGEVVLVPEGVVVSNDPPSIPDPNILWFDLE